MNRPRHLNPVRLPFRHIRAPYGIRGCAEAGNPARSAESGTPGERREIGETASPQNPPQFVQEAFHG